MIGMQPQQMQPAQPAQPMMPGQAQPMMPGQAAPQGPAQMPPGIQSLLGQPPGKPAAGVDAQTPVLQSMNLEQLTQLFVQQMLPGAPKKFEPITILSEIGKKTAELEAQAAAKNAAVTAQNAQQQGLGSITQQVLQKAAQAKQQQPQETQMAARGGLMRGYADGGVVAFQFGGSAVSQAVGDFPGYQNPEFDENGLPRSRSEREAIIVRNAQAKAAYERYRAAQARAATPAPRSLTSLSTPQGFPIEAIRRMQEFPPVGPRGGETPEDRERVQAQLATTPPIPKAIDQTELDRVKQLTQQGPQFDIRNPASAIPQLEAQLARVSPSERAGIQRQIDLLRQRMATQSAASQQQTPEMMVGPQPPEATRSLAPSPPAAPQGLPAALEKLLSDRESTLRTRMGVPEDVAAGRAGLDALMRQQIESEERLARQREAEAARLYQERTGRLEIDPLALAANISTKKGEVVGSLARALAGERGRIATATEAARKEREFAQREAQEIDRNTSKMRVLEAQRQQAVREKDYDRANALEDQLATLRLETAKLTQDYQDKQESLRLQGITAEAAKTQAETGKTVAGKPTSEIQLLEWSRSPENKKLYDEAQSAKREEDRRVKLLELYIKNQLQLADKYPTFEDFYAAFGQTTGKAPESQFRVIGSRPKE